ncbi:MAG TPA: phosphopantothenoylcysteine decarboxylase [Candidatus Binatia bacterium]|nr:phosphopantothenoylcysteine decarboxylase [Candidatus Binatia bacterium]
MKCIVTAGPTYEPLDEVRRLTNFSTGRLGTELAEFLVARGHEVTLLRGEQSTWTQPVKARVLPFTTTANLHEQLKAAGKGVDAVFHAAAVSDFAFGRIWQRAPGGELTSIKGRKVSSRLENLFAELVPTPKIITELRDWFPEAFLVGWKFESGGDGDSAVADGRKQIADCRTNACVVNGPAYGAGFGLLTVELQHCARREALFAQLAAILPKPGR